ncbi:hypothetical protein N1851_034250 [Merluccius polli]|uniref:Uncharacterized protein n=1 Tax=Merluccius polli TaxID=89951 RepID=A0AA47NLV4_MERPO|nr:hypothetical protein N1851_034250 [Merluccius polli]
MHCLQKTSRDLGEAEANHIPDIPTGETWNLEDERLSLLTEVRKRNNRAVIKNKMDRTFSLRRQEIVAKESGVEEVKERWPALFTVDEHHSKLIEIIRNKGGAVREKTRDVLKVLDQSLDVSLRRECLLKCLILWRRCTKTHQGVSGRTVHKFNAHLVIHRQGPHAKVGEKDDTERELQQCTMAVFVIREEEDLLQSPRDVGIIIEGLEVLNELPVSQYQLHMVVPSYLASYVL